ncbi:hypothetical protein ACH4KO_19980 [Streptomyces anulatus]
MLGTFRGAGRRALKLKILKKLPCNGKGARVMMGGARNVAVQAAADKCPNGRLSDKLPKGMSQEIAEGYDLYKQGRLVSHDIYRGNEWPKWAGAKEYAVPGAPDNQRQHRVEARDQLRGSGRGNARLRPSR